MKDSGKGILMNDSEKEILMNGPGTTATYPGVCPRCNRTLELPPGTISPDDGSFLIHCECCNQDVSGTLSSASPREN